MNSYEVDEAQASRFRARQLEAVLRLTPIATGANIINAALVAVAVWGQGSPIGLMLWVAVMVLAAARGLEGWMRARRRARPTAPRRAIRRAVLHSGILGALWAALPVFFFAELDYPTQFFVGLVTTGMICAGGFALSSIPAAATLYVLLICSGCLYGLAQSTLPNASVVGGLLLAYCGVVIYAALSSARLLGAQLMAEAEADHQKGVISLLLRDFEDHAADILWQVDASGRFVRVSEHLAAALGVRAERLQGMRAPLLLKRFLARGGEAHGAWAALLRDAAAHSGFRNRLVEFRARREPRWWSLSAKPLTGSTGEHLGWRGVARDVTQSHLAHQRLSWLAHYDDLTGLINRVRLREVLDGLLGAPGGPQFTFMVLDLDNFKHINDISGYAFGDRLLCRFADRLVEAAGPEAIVARLAGAEFAVIAPQMRELSVVVTLADRLARTLAEPYSVDAKQALLRVSLGIAMAPLAGASADKLMSSAEIALNTAKQQGGNRYCFFHVGLAEAERRRMAMVQALAGAVERGELHLVYQPRVRAGDGTITGFEALLRWRHEDFGEVSPIEFIAVAEQAGLMPEIGGWVLEEACREAGRWGAELRISINVSATQLMERGFAERVSAAAAALGQQRVELEITESAFIDDPDTAMATLEALRARGIRTAIDDFGTGYSSFAYLRSLTFDVLKIDRSFVSNLYSEGNAAVLVEGILALSRALGIVTVAEGVEGDAEVALLRAGGCDELQGYRISRPMPAAAIEAFMASWARQLGESGGGWRRAAG